MDILEWQASSGSSANKRHQRNTIEKSYLQTSTALVPQLESNRREEFRLHRFAVCFSASACF
jgi:hypothetical protein